MVGAQRADGGEDVVAALQIDADGRLVEDDQARAVQQPGREVEAALHAAGEAAHRLARSILQPGQRQRPLDPLGQLGAAQAVQAAEEAQVLPRGQILVQGQVLWHQADGAAGGERVARQIVTGHARAAPAGRDHAAHHRDGRGLAGAVGSEQAEDLALLDVQVEGTDSAQRAVVLSQPPTLQERHRALP